MGSEMCIRDRHVRAPQHPDSSRPVDVERSSNELDVSLGCEKGQIEGEGVSPRVAHQEKRKRRVPDRGIRRRSWRRIHGAPRQAELVLELQIARNEYAVRRMLGCLLKPARRAEFLERHCRIEARVCRGEIQGVEPSTTARFRER